jgi:hypothetical protein
MKKSKRMTTGEAIFLLIAGLILGTVFTFGMKYWNTPIAQEEAQQVTATFSSYKTSTTRGHVKQIILRFDDQEQLYIAGVSIDDGLLDAIRKLTAGTVVEMLVHPNSNTILEMEVGTERLLKFQDSIDKLSSEATGFMYLGIFCYAFAAAGSFHLIKRKKR